MAAVGEFWNRLRLPHLALFERAADERYQHQLLVARVKVIARPEALPLGLGCYNIFTREAFNAVRQHASSACAVFRCKRQDSVGTVVHGEQLQRQCSCAGGQIPNRVARQGHRVGCDSRIQALLGEALGDAAGIDPRSNNCIARCWQRLGTAP